MERTFSLWRAFGIERHHQLLLKWMVVTAVAVFAFFIAASFGLVEQVFTVDRTWISVAITVAFRDHERPLRGAHRPHFRRTPPHRCRCAPPRRSARRAGP